MPIGATCFDPRYAASVYLGRTTTSAEAFLRRVNAERHRRWLGSRSLFKFTFFFQACFTGRITKGVAHALNFHPCPVSEVLPWPFGLRLLRALAGWALFPIHRFSVTSTLDGSLHMNCEKYMTYMQIGESQLAGTLVSKLPSITTSLRPHWDHG